MRRFATIASRGISLLEAIVALVVLSVMTVAAFEALRTGQRGIAMAESRSRALAIARNELARAGIDWPLASGRRTGAIGGYIYAVEARPRPEPEGSLIVQGAADSDPLVYDVTVRVTWTVIAGRPPQELRLDTIRYAGAQP